MKYSQSFQKKSGVYYKLNEKISGIAIRLSRVVSWDSPVLLNWDIAIKSLVSSLFLVERVEGAWKS